VSLQLKNAKQIQLAAEAAKRREEEILRAKAENLQQQQQQQPQDHEQQSKTELSTQPNVDQPSEAVEQSMAETEEQTSGVIEVVESTGADKDTSAKTAGDEMSSSADNSEQITAEVISESKVHADIEQTERQMETDHHEMQSAVTEITTDVQHAESSEEAEKLENAAGDLTIVTEAVPVVVVASTDGEAVQTADVSAQSDLSQPDTESHMAGEQCTSAGIETVQEEQPSELKLESDQLIADVDKTKLDIADDVIRSVSDESSDAYTDVLEDETDHLSDILEGQGKTKRKEDIEYVELCDESSSTVEPNANKEDNKEETEKELDSILDDVHLDESEHGNYWCFIFLFLKIILLIFFKYQQC